MFDYWEALRAGRPGPVRSEIDPDAFGDILEHAFLLEKAGEGNIRFRLAGMGLCQLMGMEVRGMTPLALFDLSARDEVTSAMERVFGADAFAELFVHSHEPGKPPIEGHMLLLPVESDTGRFDRALGCLVTCGEIGRAPRHFAVSYSRLTRIVATRRPEAPRWRSAPIAGFAEAADGFDMSGYPARAEPGGPLPEGKGDETARCARLRRLQAEAQGLARGKRMGARRDWGRTGGVPAPHLRLVVDRQEG